MNTPTRVRGRLETELVRGFIFATLRPEEVSEYFDITGLGDVNSFLATALSLEVVAEDDSERALSLRRAVGELSGRFAEAGYIVKSLVEKRQASVLILSRRSESDGQSEDKASVERLNNPLEEKALYGLNEKPDAYVVARHASNFAKRIRRKFGIQCHIGIFPGWKEPRFAHHAFRYAAVARSLASSQNLTVASDLDAPDVPLSRRNGGPGTAEDRYASYPYEAERSLYEALVIGDTVSAIHAMDSALDTILLHNPDIRRSRLRSIELITVVARELDLEPTRLEHSRVPVLEAVECAASAAELRTAVHRFIDSLVEQAAGDAHGGRNPQIARVRSLIARQFDRELSLETVAREVRLSPHYFSRAFKADTGMNFVDYVNSVRIRNAKRLLRHSDFSIKEIASKVGFEDPNYFSRVFRQHASITPSDYRRNSLL